ncbi:MFS domain-containing histidine kinase [Sunxiuqinia elliptica]|uniref:histidine kinase n=1 Tax=Sunxiuqinia elliptica TaxID=655355 RepID=A0A1I2F765_9BACT|nr:MFS domain-containing histidine kinase [Sunxiuqinia elliptica]SFF00995.1 His Kinase A (phospho-acceptor) domain-containing protein [Sunxiuqinia elliptica]
MEWIKKYSYLILSLLLFVFAFVQEHHLLYHNPENELVEKFEFQLHKQKELLNEKLDGIEKVIADSTFDGNYQASLIDYSELYHNQGLGFVVLEKNELIYWSHNHFAFTSRYSSKMANQELLALPNGTYLGISRQVDSLNIIGLIHIKDVYGIENQFINNQFVKPFKLPDSFVIQREKSEYNLPVRDEEGNYLFSVMPSGKIKCTKAQLLVPAGLFALAFIFLLFFVRRVFKDFRHEDFLTRVIILALGLLGFYWFHVLFRIPQMIDAFELFGPSLYAYSFWLPSLGDLLVLAVLIFFWSLNFSKDFTYSKRPKWVELALVYGFSLFMYLLTNYLIENLIQNSSISFQLNRIDDIDQYSVVGYCIVALLFFSAFLINLKIVELSERYFSRTWFLRVHLLLIAVFVGLVLIVSNGYLYMVGLFLLTNFSVVALQNTQFKRYSLSYLIYFVSLFAFFSLISIQHYNKLRRVESQKLMTVTLNSEHDPAAEIFLTEIQEELNVDSIIPYLLSTTYDELENYIERQYFGGYFRKYDVDIILCRGSDSLLLENENEWVPCFPFFEEMISESGTRIPGTNFYFMDNLNGRISYMGQIFYPLSAESIGTSVFFELNSRLLPEGAGFPELLLDKSMAKPDRYRHFSYAKYFEKELVHLSGDYQYNYYVDSYDIQNDTDEFVLKKWDDHDHLIHNLGNGNYIVVSSKSFELLDYLISFPYLFVFYFIFILVVVFGGNPSYRKKAMVFDLKFKIQASIITVVLLSLFVVAGGTIFYNIQEYENKHQDDLNEKMKSIAEEIDMRLSDVGEISPDLVDWLWRELNKLSIIFRTDINIFGVNGELIASSRPEIYLRGIISNRVNTEAYYELIENYQVNYSQPEKIGNLSYLSVYEPIINNMGDYLGFINLPYFTRGDELKQEISTFIVAFINLYVLLFLASVIVAVLLANQITRPLSMVREKLKGIQLVKKNEQIVYQGDDEIGALIQEYNRKVEELAESAELLARSERELAWREMAKQIAHEIKNPLTPMKLNIQYLRRAKDEKGEHFDEFFDRVTGTLIEQIDTLSEIATEFSNFAKIPKARNEVFDLTDELNKVAGLFETSTQIDFSVYLREHEKLLIYADHEQISRAVVNLVKNAIQSIPPQRKGKVELLLSKQDNQAIVAVKDNGSGIPEDIRQQMFQPNFTTKSSGMGLGLAIVKKIIENAKGTIWFETELDVGSTFYIELPLYEEE